MPRPMELGQAASAVTVGRARVPAGRAIQAMLPAADCRVACTAADFCELKSGLHGRRSDYGSLSVTAVMSCGVLCTALLSALLGVLMNVYIAT